MTVISHEARVGCRMSAPSVATLPGRTTVRQRQPWTTSQVGQAQFRSIVYTAVLSCHCDVNKPNPFRIRFGIVMAGLWQSWWALLLLGALTGHTFPFLRQAEKTLPRHSILFHA